MRTQLTDVAQYTLPIVDVLDKTGEFPLNEWVGKEVKLRFENAIHCIETGKKIKKTFGEGLSYDAWLKSPMAVESIIRPELSRIHEGIALRDKEWEEEHHNKPHYVYLSRTADVKVGVTRTQNIPSRWIDHGAVEALVIAETPYRQLAGLMEVALKDHLPDKTAWQSMLKNAISNHTPLEDIREQVFEWLGEEYEPFFADMIPLKINYPVIAYPEKVKSMKLDTAAEIGGRLMGIKGQYLLFEGGAVFNVRAHSGYRVSIETH